ncbi:hypothetical protein R1sor_024808 [Riccia sorocarpa]|uniref:Uncharacterized protein n=1 Tax=Riccia sorocarpa TaxID=122646 RepID=A0ABD3GTT3_9MARC
MRKVVETKLGLDMGPTAYTIGLERNLDKPSPKTLGALGRHEVSVEEKRRREAEDRNEEEVAKRRSTRRVEFTAPPQPSSEASTSRGPENMEGVERQSTPPSKKEGKKEKESSGKGKGPSVENMVDVIFIPF